MIVGFEYSHRISSGYIRSSLYWMSEKKYIYVYDYIRNDMYRYWNVYSEKKR